MKVLGVTDKVTKKQFQEIAKYTKNYHNVEIFTFHAMRMGKPYVQKHIIIVNEKGMQHRVNENQLLELLSKKYETDIDFVALMFFPIRITYGDFEDVAHGINSESVIKVKEIYHQKYARLLDQRINDTWDWG